MPAWNEASVGAMRGSGPAAAVHDREGALPLHPAPGRLVLVAASREVHDQELERPAPDLELPQQPGPLSGAAAPAAVGIELGVLVAIDELDPGAVVHEADVHLAPAAAQTPELAAIGQGRAPRMFWITWSR